MATVPQTAAVGATLYGTSPRVVDDTPDRMVGGVYSHNPVDASATMWGEIVSRLLFLEDPYMQVYACAVGVAVGNPVYASGSVTVAKALANDVTKTKVIGFVAYKPTTTTCVVRSAYLASGAFSGFGVPVYLTDAGGIDDAVGTVAKVLGTAISTTAAIVWADPRSAQEDGPTSELDIYGSHGEALKILSVSEEITLAAAATTDSTANLLPAGAVIKSICGRVTNGFAGTFKVGDSGVDDRAASGISAALNTTFDMLNQAVPTSPYAQGSTAQKIRLTPSGGAGAAGGKVRVTVFYEIVTPPTS